MLGLIMNFFSILPYLTYFIVIFIFGFGINTEVNAHDAKKVPCTVDIIYGDDDVGVASYFGSFPFSSWPGETTRGGKITSEISRKVASYF